MLLGSTGLSLGLDMALQAVQESPLEGDYAVLSPEKLAAVQQLDVDPVGHVVKWPLFLFLNCHVCSSSVCQHLISSEHGIQIVGTDLKLV